MTIKQAVKNVFQPFPAPFHFHAYDLIRNVRGQVDGHPFDGTILRKMRELRGEGWDIRLEDKKSSLYKIVRKGE